MSLKIIISYDRSRENTKGAKIQHPDVYLQNLILKLNSIKQFRGCAYTRASVKMRQKYGISFYIDVLKEEE